MAKRPLGFNRWNQAMLFVCVCTGVALSQTSDLQRKIGDIAAEAQGKVAVACSLPGTALNCDLRAEGRPPMQSVFKLPLALTTLHQVEQGSLSLDQSVRFRADDRILPETYSPLQEKFPEANVDVSLRELLKLAVSESDNVAADILLRVAGGPAAVDEYIASLGIAGFHLQDSEHGLHADPMAQYRNWLTPHGAVQLLRRISDRSPLSPEHTALLLQWMQSSVKPRLQLDLPADTLVAHKAGTSGVDAGIAHATNDIGLITLPDERRLAIAVFITDSRADETARERVIARIARAAYDRALTSVRPPGEGVAPSLTLEDFARQTLSDSDATGFIHVRDVSSGEVLAHVTTRAADIKEPELAIDSPMRPLSVIKVYLAAEWLEHGFGSTAVDCTPSYSHARRRMFVDDMLISGCDTAAEKMALILRRKLGPERVLEDLRHYGLQDMTLKPDASDDEWGRVLSLGEEEVPVTPRRLSAFLRTIGQGGAGLFSQRTAKRLRTALENVVQHGTANSIKDALATTGWRIGGKTGTGPGQCGGHCDGWFASLVSDQNRPRYVILVFIRGRGLGGGLSAQTAARVAEYLRTCCSVAIAPTADYRRMFATDMIRDPLSGTAVLEILRCVAG